MEGQGRRERGAFGKIDQRESVIIVTSVRGGSGVSSVCAGLSEELAVYYGKKPLVISLEPFPAARQAAAEAGDVKRLLMRILSGKEMTEGYMSQYVCSENGVYRFNYGRGSNPVSELDATDVNKLISAVLRVFSADPVILDLPAGKAAQIRDLADFYDDLSVVAVERTGSCPDTACEEVRYGGTLSSGADIPGHAELIKEFLPFSDRFRVEAFLNADDPESFAGGIVRIDGEWGVSIKELAAKLTEF